MRINRKHNRVTIFVFAYFLVSFLSGMLLRNHLLMASAPICLLAYMVWSFYDSKRRDWMPPDPPFGRGPDPFLFRANNSEKVTISSTSTKWF
jgi:hypothetical protein